MIVNEINVPFCRTYRISLFSSTVCGFRNFCLQSGFYGGLSFLLTYIYMFQTYLCEVQNYLEATCFSLSENQLWHGLKWIRPARMKSSQLLCESLLPVFLCLLCYVAILVVRSLRSPNPHTTGSGFYTGSQVPKRIFKCYWVNIPIDLWIMIPQYTFTTDLDNCQ